MHLQEFRLPISFTQCTRVHQVQSDIDRDAFIIRHEIPIALNRLQHLYNADLLNQACGRIVLSTNEPSTDCFPPVLLTAEPIAGTSLS
jgi:hypothetical protein